jgi:hypothetical protein
MLSYRLQCLIRRNFGSGDNRMLVSVGLRAVVGMIPLFSGRELRFKLKVESDSSGGFKRLTSSLKSCRIRDPRVPSHPVRDAEDFCEETATPVEERPYNSIEVTPTIVIHSRSLSSRPSSEAREYIIDAIGSEYDAPRE